MAGVGVLKVVSSAVRSWRQWSFLAALAMWLLAALSKQRWRQRFPFIFSGILLKAKAFLIPLTLAACSMTTSRVSDGLSSGDLQQSNSGVVFLLMGVAGNSCPLARIGLGRAQKGGGYRQSKILLVRNNWWDKGGVPQVVLPAGTYHIVSWVCEQGRYVRSIGRKQKNSLSWASLYLQSYASFSVAAGEVVNAGYLRMVNMGGLEYVRFDVKDLPPRAHAQLRKDRPRLYARMRTRLMLPGRKTVPPEPLAEGRPAPSVAQ